MLNANPLVPETKPFRAIMVKCTRCPLLGVRWGREQAPVLGWHFTSKIWPNFMAGFAWYSNS